ncbi:NAD-P-binding protein [Mycena vulgaris]|nr:NAD-P-binding protein [Mycena vulgaris]
MPAPSENLSVTLSTQASIRTPTFLNKTYVGKSVLITGASRGIGREIACFYARAGASLSLVSRNCTTLDCVKTQILAESPEAHVVTFIADVVDTQAVRAAVQGTIAAFGKLDILVANAGRSDTWDSPFTQCDPDDWWNTVETNLRGVYNVAHFALPELVKTSGYSIILSSAGAQQRAPCSSPYVVSKHAVNRLTEYIPIENPSVKAFALDPGAIKTDMTALIPSAAPWLVDTLALPAATCLRLTSGRDDWLSGRYISANWNLDEIEKMWKARILEQDALVNRLQIPV